jgi:sulfur carrier protein
MNRMEIILNGEKETLEGAENINELLQGLELNPDIVTVSLNGKILKKEEFGTLVLKAGDAVDVLLFMGGGR